MAEQDIVQNMIRALGQSQRQRFAEALGIHHADIDEYSTAELLRCIKKFAAHVNYYKNDLAAPAGSWSTFFPYPDDAAAIESWLAQCDAATTPHLALLIAFLNLYKEPQSLINQLTGRHLDFYYRDVLRLAPQPAQPDRAHLVLELKKNAAPVRIDASNVFSAGKDATGVELLYTPVRETLINQAQVASIRSLYMDDTNGGIVRYAPVANSGDGLGGELDAEDPQWPGFGTSALPAADTGFALASPVLRMQEGSRSITVTLVLADADGLASVSLDNCFQVYLTGENNWLGPFSVDPEFDSGTLQFTVGLEAGAPAVIDYDPAVHGLSYTTQDPLLYVRLCNDGTTGYSSFAHVRLSSARIAVDVQGATSLQLENDTGTFNPQKAFTPFGPQPGKGSRFLIGYEEAFSKKLASVELTVQWKDAPASFSSHYQAYNAGVSSNAYFTASASFTDAGGWNLSQPAQALFESADATVSHKLTFTNPAAPATATAVTPASGGASDEEWLYALKLLGTTWAAKSIDQFVLHNPVYASSMQNIALPETQAEKLVLTLDKDFLHASYRKKFVENVMAFSKSTTSTTITLLEEPYTPTVQSLSLSYRAYTDLVAIDSAEAADFANPDLQFFHVGYSGQMREHGYLREQFDFIDDKSVYLLPQFPAEGGELLIGIRNLVAGDSVSLLFQVAEGSADPDLDAGDITWSALCDNYWKTLSSDEYVLDTTNRLRSSGIVKIVIPGEATATNTLLMAGHIWLKAAVAGNVNAVCQLVEIAANAVEVEFTDQGNDPAHRLSAHEPGKIAKLKNGLTAIKSVRQSYASFGGRAEEQETAFHVRVAERLRHKDRSQTAWDYERIVLQAFPAVHKAKCIPHARPEAWLAPGHVMLVVVPDLSNRNAMNPLTPKVDSNTISSIAETLQKRCGMQVTLHVRNPSYQKVKLDFKVKFKTGYEFNYYRTQLNQALLEYLSPWAFADDDASAADIRFGGSLYKSVLLNVVDELEYVDFVTDFKLYSYVDESEVLVDMNEVQARTPDAILVSESEHVITEY